MGTIERLLSEIDELYISKNVSIRHDEARMSYSLDKNTVGSYEDFTHVIADYYNHHFSRCVMHGGYLSHTEAAGRAKEILEQVYRRQGGNILTAYNDAHDATNGGLRVVLDKMAERLKEESVERHIRQAFDSFVALNSYEQKVDIMSQFMARYGHLLSSSIQADKPERYATSYEETIRSYVEALKRTSSVFRRI